MTFTPNQLLTAEQLNAEIAGGGIVRTVAGRTGNVILTITDIPDGAPLTSPLFTGEPRGPTAAPDTNTVQLATTAFVLAQAASANPLMDGAVSPGIATRFSRADHVHPRDTSKLDLAGGILTGDLTLSLESPTVAINRISGATGSGYLNFLTANVLRWRLLNTGAETGSNAGANLQLQAFDDTGTLLGTPLIIARASKQVSINGAATGTGLLTIRTNAAAAAESALELLNNSTDAAASVALNLRTDTGILRAALLGRRSGTNNGDAVLQSAVGGALRDHAVFKSDGSAVVGVAANIVTFTADGQLRVSAAAPVAAADLTRKDYVDGQVTTINNALALKAPLNSPAFTGNPTAPTQSADNNTTCLATTNFVLNSLWTLSVGASGTGALALSPAQANQQLLKFTGTLTGARTISVPDTILRSWVVQNATSGAFSLTFKTLSGTGVVIPQGSTYLCYNDGTNMRAIDLNLSGAVTLGGDLTISKATPRIVLDASADGQHRYIVGSKAGSARWAISMGDSAAETGSNAGSNFGIRRYDDSGAYVDSPFFIDRGNGGATFLKNVSTPLVDGGPGSAGNLRTNGTLNSVNFRWDGSNLFYRVDELVDRSISYTSDARVKTNVAPASADALGMLLALPLYEYDHVEGLPETYREGHVGRVPVGLFAQDLEQRGLDFAVLTSKQPDGRPACVPADLKAVRMDALVPYIIRALHQLYAMCAPSSIH